MTAGTIILGFCLLAIVLGLITGRRSAQQGRPLRIRFVPCDGACGNRVMIMGSRYHYGEHAYCAQCWSVIDGVRQRYGSRKV